MCNNIILYLPKNLYTPNIHMYLQIYIYMYILHTYTMGKKIKIIFTKILVMDKTEFMQDSTGFYLYSCYFSIIFK